MTSKVLITCKQMQVELPKHRARIEAAGYELVVPELVGQQFSATEMIDLSRGVVGIIAGDDELNNEFFEGAPELSVLIRWGIGMDSVDHRSAQAHDVIVRNTPGVFGDEVADSAFALVLALARGIVAVDGSVRSGAWLKFEGVTLAGSTLGVIGLGVIGRAVAERGFGFGMKVVGFDPYLAPGTADDRIQVTELQELLSVSRFVVVTCPSTPETFHLIDADALNTMLPDAYLINVARGPVVSEEDLVEALNAGTIAGAGLDVFEVEPLPVNSGLRLTPNTVLGAHNGSNTREGVERASSVAVDYLLEELARTT